MRFELHCIQFPLANFQLPKPGPFSRLDKRFRPHPFDMRPERANPSLYGILRIMKLTVNYRNRAQTWGAFLLFIPLARARGGAGAAAGGGRRPEGSHSLWMYQQFSGFVFRARCGSFWLGGSYSPEAGRVEAFVSQASNGILLF